MDSPPMREAHNAVLPRVSAFIARIPLRAALWARIKAFSETEEARSLGPVGARCMAFSQMIQ